MNTRKLILTVAFAVNVAIIAAISAASIHQHSVRQANAIELGTVVVRPADAVPEMVNLATIVVTPTDADWEYAEAHGVQRPVTTVTSMVDNAAVEAATKSADAEPVGIDLGAIAVTPTNADRAYAEAHGVQHPVAAMNSGFDAGMNEDAAAASLIQVLNALSPGQYMVTDAALSVLNTLAFAGQGG
ncbi:MAG: hypothetical protein ACRETA_09695 [Gammaproteobacteria bacterium]